MTLDNCVCGEYRPHWKEIHGRSITQNKPLNMCENCGTVVDAHPLSYSGKLGDKIMNAMNVTGVAKGVKKLLPVDYDCGCEERRQQLNNF